MIELHCSSLSYYNDCPRRASTKMFSKEIKSQGYELKRFGFRNISANIGTACHSGAKVAFDTHDSKQAVDAGISDLQELNEDVKFDTVSPNMNIAEKQTKRIITSHYINVAKHIEPIYTEHRLEARINDEFILDGKLDAITSDIHDLKTGKDAKCQAQLGGYSLLAKAKGISVDKLLVDWLPKTKIDSPQIYEKIQFEIDVCERLAKSVIKRIQADYKVFEFPCNNNSMLCSAKWCRAYGTDYCEVTL